ncbi:MAG: hypothetical protein JO055_16190 [Alphaproteobacteria bacterium]|nr:hypothetical protein [Alphaproteobacteria bacterium]
MRVRETKGGLTVQAIGGAHVVLLAFNMDRDKCPGLKGFAIHRTDHTEEDARWLEGMKTFEATDPKMGRGMHHSTRKQPIQDFMWSDYTAQPGCKYTYRVIALKGTPEKLTEFAEVSVTVETEDPKDGKHDVFFNRGATASQEYARRFDNRKPGSQGGDADPVWKWLSRGAHEAILDFIARATGPGFGLRVCAYEFRLKSVLEALGAAHRRKADVEILYDAGKAFPRDENRKVVKATKIKDLCTERLPKPQALSHNKFIVLLKGKKPVAVLTGSTNFSEGGVFGQGNVVHVVDDEKVAADYLAYWESLSGNPNRKELAPELSDLHKIPDNLPPKGTICIFSPRSDASALDYYAKLAGTAEGGLFMTFAFGMNNVFKPVYESGKAKLRYALMEKLLGPGVKKEKIKAATNEMIALRKLPATRFAVGSQLSFSTLDRWLGEKLTNLNTHVKYIHTKFMLVDPLSDDPIVVTGSANFSKASSDANDENMILIRGDKRVADIYLGEYMRLWEHYAFREWATAKAKEAKSKAKTSKVDIAKFGHLDDTDKWWKSHFGNTEWSRVRQYFAGE